MTRHRRPAPGAICLLATITVLLGTGSAATAQLANTPWPMINHDLRHTGQSELLGPMFPGAAVPAGNVRTYHAVDKIKTSPAVGADGTIFVGMGFYFCALYPETMTKKWCTRLLADVSESSPAIGIDGTVYLGDRDNSLTAFNPLTGAVIWRYNTNREGDIWTAPAIGPDGTIYFAFTGQGGSFGIFTALNPDGTLKWKFPPLGVPIPASSPAVVTRSDGTYIYLGSSDGVLHAFKDSGPGNVSRVWKTKVGSKIQSSAPVVGSDGTIYIGSTGGLHAVSPEGLILWTFTTGGTVGTTAALATDGTLYVGSKAQKLKTLYAINPDGTQKWKYGPVHVEEDAGAYPAIGADGVIYVGLNKGVYAFSPDGALLWSHQTGNFIISYPAIAGKVDPNTGEYTGILYIGSKDWKVYKLWSLREPVGPINHVPVAKAGVDQQALVGDPVNFDGSQSFDADNDPLTYSWNFGDNSPPASGPTATHNYASAGTYTVTLTVSDGSLVGTDSAQAVVNQPGVPGSIIDQFDRADSTILGNGWEEVGDLLISNQELRNNTIKGNHIALQSLTGPTQTVSAKFVSVNNSQNPRLGFVLRYLNAQNYYLFYRLTGATNVVRISRVLGGVETVLASTPMPAPTLNVPFVLEAQASASSLKLWLNGVQKLSISNSSFADGRVGVYLGTGIGSSSYRTDDFSATVGQ